MAPNPQFFLKTAPLPGEPPSPYTNLYLRHHGSGINSVVLTPAPPKFIKGHLDGKRIIFTSASHEGRQWGLTLRTDGGQRAGWEKVEIVEDGGSDGLVFSEGVGDGKEELLEFEEEDSGEKVWKGFMVCEWAHGHPQLFWVTYQLKGELPSFCHRVQIVREML
ncbi:uncharacterized protein PAC_12783 [Phialocephala subalpina]|uniref:DUF7907 domain-containing protein n=1 Tax=Phialocephala subalpina TaxID=576137 RepID=A0A1L7XD16_9HELO|nr:uncharacterized protein PAC_12783 [Phialocephala subalpina]